jgi:hypothetical protein
MPQPTASIATILTTLLFSAGLVIAQQAPSPDPGKESISVPVSSDNRALTNNWIMASSLAASKKKLFVVT